MSTRRRFSGEFKAKVALEALRGDKTIQEIATRHKIHPNHQCPTERRFLGTTTGIPHGVGRVTQLVLRSRRYPRW